MALGINCVKSEARFAGPGNSGDNNEFIFWDVDADIFQIVLPGTFDFYKIHVIFIDSKNRTWIAGENGVAIYDESTWKRYKFPGSTVGSITELPGKYGTGTIWLGTNNGAIAYTQTRLKPNALGVPQYTPEWKVYHSKNALKGDNVQGITVQGQDVWLATSQAVNEYKHSENQILLF